MRALLFGLLLITMNANAGLRWKQVVQVDSVYVEIIKVNQRELNEMAQTPLFQGERLRGLSKLYRLGDGSFRCEVFLVDLRDKKALDHELRHCHGEVHN